MTNSQRYTDIGTQLRSIERTLSEIAIDDDNRVALGQLHAFVAQLQNLHAQLFTGSGQTSETRIDIDRIANLVETLQSLLAAGLHYAASMVRIDVLTTEVSTLRAELVTFRQETQLAREATEQVSEKMDKLTAQWEAKEKKYEASLSLWEQACARRVFYEVLDLLEAVYWEKTERVNQQKQSLRVAVVDKLLNEDTIRNELDLASPTLDPFLNFIDTIKDQCRPNAHVSQREMKFDRKKLYYLADEYLSEGNAPFFKKAVDRLCTECGLALDEGSKPMQEAYKALGKTNQ
ncbi:hypothetical protein HK097_009545 [Rhizophlyctis rosea]|uniref:Uncharacterized protein n=1 Tax=Rhizophlyctis rosea TaxID=64517 RepID=A0AAD5SAD5_9FUNG|nr:hypothetical protein HK097_009545 [Rhizophlyctis rosea]